MRLIKSELFVFGLNFTIISFKIFRQLNQNLMEMHILAHFFNSPRNKIPGKYFPIGKVWPRKPTRTCGLRSIGVFDMQMNFAKSVWFAVRLHWRTSTHAFVSNWRQVARMGRHKHDLNKQFSDEQTHRSSREVVFSQTLALCDEEGEDKGTLCWCCCQVLYLCRPVLLLRAVNYCVYLP